MNINKAPRYVLVNVPAFFAQAVEHGTLALETNVIIGKPARATPQVSAKIIEVNFYPTWSVPDIVAQQRSHPHHPQGSELLLRAAFHRHARLGSAAARSRLGRLVLAAGGELQVPPGAGATQNALGRRAHQHAEQAFRLHARYAAEAAFRPERARLLLGLRAGAESVSELVAWLLGDQRGWTLEKVQAQIDSGKKLNVKLGIARAGAFRLSHRFCRRQRLRPVQARHLWPRCLLRRSRRPAGCGGGPTEPRGHALAAISLPARACCGKSDRAPHATPGHKTPPPAQPKLGGNSPAPCARHRRKECLG